VHYNHSRDTMTTAPRVWCCSDKTWQLLAIEVMIVNVYRQFVKNFAF
jgi:hypothetical protein